MRFLAVLFLILFLPIPTFSQEASKPNKVSKSEEQRLSTVQAGQLNEWLPRAKEGDAGMQLRVGDLYAVKSYYNKKSRLGCDPMGGCQEYAGVGPLSDIVTNDNEALDWWKKAANHEDSIESAIAQEKIGMAYSFGFGAFRVFGSQRIVPQDYLEASFWYSLSAKHGWCVKDKNQACANAAKSVESHLNQEQIDAIKKRVEDWKPTLTQGKDQ